MPTTRFKLWFIATACSFSPLAGAATMDVHAACSLVMLGEKIPSSAPTPSPVKPGSTRHDAEKQIAVFPAKGTETCSVFIDVEGRMISWQVIDTDCSIKRKLYLAALWLVDSTAYAAAAKGQPTVDHTNELSVAIHKWTLPGKPNACSVQAYDSEFHPYGRKLDAMYAVGESGPLK